MKPILGTILLVALIALGSCASGPKTKDDGAAPLSWLIGTWRTEGETRYTIESWERDAAGLLNGTSETFRDGRRVTGESIVIEERDGALHYIASPEGQDGNAFRLIESSDAHAVFEDPAHDFPQRVIYRLESPDLLVARIEGTIRGQARSSEWRYRRER